MPTPSNSQDASTGHQQFSRQLVDAARQSVIKAISHDDNSEWREFVMEAAIGLELLCKAFLFNKNPTLIADPRSEPSIIALASGDLKSTASMQLRTIGAEQAIKRARQLGAPISDQFKDDLTTIRMLRNSLAHIGAYSHQQSKLVFNSWIRTIVAIADAGGWSRRRIFGIHQPVVDQMLQDFQSEVEQTWERRRANAQQRWSEYTSQHSDDDIDLVRIRLEREHAEANLDDPTYQIANCPVCELPAWLDGRLEVEPSMGGGGDVYVDWVFEPDELRCTSCDLLLDSPALVRQSGVLSDWELPEEDYERWVHELMESTYEDFL